MIDGAKGKWCIVLLLDAIIFLLKNNEFNVSFRRAFNQSVVLYECILHELHRVNSVTYDEIVLLKKEDSFKSQLLSNSENNFPRRDSRMSTYSHLNVKNLEYPWGSMGELSLCLLDGGPQSKAKNKFGVIAEMLCNHECFLSVGSDLTRIVKEIVVKSMFVFNTHRPFSIIPSDPPVPNRYRIPRKRSRKASVVSPRSDDEKPKCKRTRTSTAQKTSEHEVTTSVEGNSDDEILQSDGAVVPQNCVASAIYNLTMSDAEFDMLMYDCAFDDDDFSAGGGAGPSFFAGFVGTAQTAAPLVTVISPDANPRQFFPVESLRALDLASSSEHCSQYRFSSSMCDG